MSAPKADLVLTYNQCTVLMAVVRYGSFTAAAAELGVSQPAVSMLVAEVEKDLGYRIFDRGANRPATITPDGSALMPHIKAFVTAADGLVAAVKSIRNITPCKAHGRFPCRECQIKHYVGCRCSLCADIPKLG